MKLETYYKHLKGFIVRIAVLIISIFVIFIIGFQSCTVGVLESFEGSETMQGSAGLAMVLFFIIGAAFVIGIPIISMVSFLLASFIGYSVDVTIYGDLEVWRVVAIILAIMSFLGHRELKKKKQSSNNKES